MADDDFRQQELALLEAQLQASRQQETLLFDALTRVLRLIDDVERH